MLLKLVQRLVNLMSQSPFKSGVKENFIIEKPIKEEGIDVSEIFFGVSSKGEERGVGLYTVMKIVESYPNASLNTICQNQVFSSDIYYDAYRWWK